MLKFGDSGAPVSSLQASLGGLGFVISADELTNATFGLTTAAAVRAFQTAHGIFVDGLAGIITMNAITSAKPAEVPGALWIPADPSNYCSRPIGSLGRYNLIVVHITSGRADAHPVAAMWQTPHHSSSAHFVIGQDATVIQAVPLRYAAYHAHSVNAFSIGIEHCAREANEPSFPTGDLGLPLSPEQLDKSAWLVAYLLKAAGLAVQRHVTIKGHAEADQETTHALCPNGVAGGWPWDSYIQAVQTYYDQIGA
jgi:N-acetyl-anhydromuramyl-L-alanine amidase AmpD